MPVYRDDGWNGGGFIGRGVTPGAPFPTSYETATLQLLIGEGQIEGLVDGLKSVYLDGTPILNSDGSKNFKGIALALVSGTNTQPAVKGIGGVESEASVNVQVPKASPVTRSITSNPSAVRVRIAIPALKVIGTDGSSQGHSVTIKIERQNAAYNGGAWEVVTLEDAGVISGGPFSSKFTRSFRVDLPASGTWQVRVTRVSDDDADAYHLSQTWWEAYTEIIDARLRYPNSAVLSLRVNANQFRSIPRVSLDLKLSRIQVPANYNPLTRAYATSGLGTTGGAWDGTFKEAWSDNPAWVFYDAAIKTRYGAGSFLTASALDKWTLYTIGQWCDTLVSDGKGGTEPRITCNLYMQNQQNAIKALGQLASIFWGVIYYASGLVVPVADADTAPVAVFNSSNVIDGKFTYEGTARSARHTAAVVKFTNPDLGWEPDTAVYEDADGIARFGYNPLDLNALGCTSHGQALRLARWSILTELLADETISFGSGLEGSTVKPGDVFQVHDQFRAGNVRFGGRVATGATTTVIPLDAPVTFGAGTHYLKIKNASGVLETRTVTTGAGTVSSLAVSGAFSVAPPSGAVWLLQAGSTASLWRCLSIRKGDGIVYDIVALKHDPAKYALLALASGDVIPRSTDPRTSPAPAGLTAGITTRILNDKQVQTLEANWTLDGALGYQAEAALKFGSWQPMAVSGASAVLNNVQPGEWRVRVSGVWPSGLSPASTYQITISQPEIIPPWIGTAQTTATSAAQAAAYADALSRSPNNLIKNGGGDDPSPQGIEAQGVTTDGNAYVGTKVRYAQANASGSGYQYVTGNIRCNPGEKYVISGMCRKDQAGPAVVGIRFQNALGSNLAFAESPGTSSAASVWENQTKEGTAPAGAAFVAFYVGGSGGSNGNTWSFDVLQAGLKVSGVMLDFDLAILGVIRSPNYVAGSFGNAPQGFKNSGYAFTTTFIDGSTDSNCFMELGGTANFGGYKVATVNSRVFGVNPVLNSLFYIGLTPWGTTGTNAPVWSSTTSTTGSGSAVQSVTASAAPGGNPASASKTGSIYQTFNAQGASISSISVKTIGLKSLTSGATDTGTTGTVKVFVQDLTAGTAEVQVGTTITPGGTWATTTIDTSSIFTGKGQYAIRIELYGLASYTSHPTLASSVGINVHVDEVTVNA